jgi:SAM-dependent methyltransferase
MEPFGYSKLFTPEELEYAFFRDLNPEISLAFQVFHDLRARHPTKILDLQCGPGLLSKGYAARGVSVVAVDSSDEMISYARTRCGEANIDWLAIMCLDSYAYLLTDEDERRFWKTIRTALREDGLLLLEVNHPKSCGYIDYSTVYTDDRPLGDLLVRIEWGINNPAPDLLTGVCNTEIRCSTTKSGVVKTRIIRSLERYHWPRDLSLMLESCGFRVARWFGGYDGQRLDWESPVVLLVAEAVMRA